MGFLLALIFISIHPISGVATLDYTFNQPNGYALWHTDNASQDRNLEMVLQKDGKILISGYTNVSGQKDIQLLRYLANGTPDPAFGQGGQILYSGGAGKDDYAFGLALDASENILVTGREHNGHDADLLLFRCKPDGSPDTNFGNNSTVRYSGSNSGTDSGRGVLVQPDGKIVVCGEVNTSSNKQLAVHRFTPNGSPDTEFGTDGIFLIGNAGGKESYGYATALDSMNRILVTGSVSVNGTDQIALVRLLANGTLDSSFGTSGIVLWNGAGIGPGYGNWVNITPSDQIVITGVDTDKSGSYDIVVLRYNQEGTLDPSFGDKGVTRLGESGYDYAWGQTSLPNGSIIVAGTTGVNGLESPALFKLTQEGTPDTTFDGDGVLTFETIGIGPLYSVIADKTNITASGYITEDRTDLGLLLRVNQT
jgi:uncharacterized delta-60 repeat protein